MVVIIDYGMGNTGSVKNAIKAIGADVLVSNKKADIEAASHIILPGVGAFQDGIKNISSSGLAGILEKEVLNKQKPFLGLCLGMQLLATEGTEGARSKGLGWIKGVVRRFEIDKSFKVPHVGWNDVKPLKKSGLFAGISRPVFYFVHSYIFIPEDNTVISAETEYGEKFPAALEKGNIFGLQFHPEKSQFAGLKVLENFLKLR